MVSLCQIHQPGPVLAKCLWPYRAALTDAARASSPVKRICMVMGPPQKAEWPLLLLLATALNSSSPPDTQLGAEVPPYHSCASKNQAMDIRGQSALSLEGPVPQEWG